GAGLFVSSRRRHTSFSRDWSSDVGSSDLARHRRPTAIFAVSRPSRLQRDSLAADFALRLETLSHKIRITRWPSIRSERWNPPPADRKSVVQGTGLAPIAIQMLAHDNGHPP